MENSFTDGIMIGGGAVSALAAVVGAWLRSRAAKNALKEHASETAVPQPLAVEQTAFQAHCKDNARDHDNMFERIRHLESDVAGHSAAILALKEMQNKIYDMVQALYERIIVSKRK